MMNGQRVIKVFTHEEASKEDFDKINNELFDQMSSANTLANIMGPVTMNIGNLQYVALVIIGAVIAISTGGASSGYTVGALAAFLQLSRSFSNNINQIARSVNAGIATSEDARRGLFLLDKVYELMYQVANP